MESMATIIQRHNSKVIKPTSENETKSCNCRKTCPMNGSGDCRKENVIYKASITSEQSTKYYYGLSEPEFKTRYNNHTASFRHKHKEKAINPSGPKGGEIYPDFFRSIITFFFNSFFKNRNT